jgi:hypothetical protein
VTSAPWCAFAKEAGRSRDPSNYSVPFPSMLGLFFYMHMDAPHYRRQKCNSGPRYAAGAEAESK